MKKITYLLFLTAIALLFLASCGKDGAVGPQGPTGPQGVVGPAGPAGANGLPGSQIYSGATTPAATTGVAGDFYLNVSTGLLYGPKTATGWGTGFSLIGPAGAIGATGASGTTVLSGTSIPAATLGKTGDYYLDDSDYLLYGPKTAAGWGTATSLQGPAGTANVEYSGWNYATNFRDTALTDVNWEIQQYYLNTNLAIGDLAAPALTTDMLNNGTFQVYCSNPNMGIFALPFEFTTNEGVYLVSWNYLPRPGHFIITSSGNITGGFSQPLDQNTQYRYVLIPGGANIGVNPHINLKDYKAVKKFYRIPD